MLLTGHSASPPGKVNGIALPAELASEVDRDCPMVLGDRHKRPRRGTTPRPGHPGHQGTDDYLLLIHVHRYGLTGHQAEQALL